MFLASVVLAIGIAFGWREYQTPLSGAGQPDNFFARWAKSRAYAIIPPVEDRAATRLTPENGNGWFSEIAEPVQSLALYQSQNPTRPTPARRTLVLQPLGAMNNEERALLAECKVYCEAFFGLPTRIAAPLSVDETRLSPRPASFGASKIQLNSSDILNRVLAPRLPADAAAYLGVTTNDLWTNGLSFVFGQATFENRIGVYSMARYLPKKPHQKFSPAQHALALRRTIQVLIHEGAICSAFRIACFTFAR